MVYIPSDLSIRELAGTYPSSVIEQIYIESHDVKISLTSDILMITASARAGW